MNILIPKSVWKSKTFLLTLLIVLIVTVFAILGNAGVVVPGWVSLILAGLSSIFIGAEKLKDAKVAASKILIEAQPQDILKLKKPVVNEEASKYLMGGGVLLNVLYGLFVQQKGVVIDPLFLGAVNTIIGTFVGFDKYKASKIEVAAALVKKKEK